MYFSDCHVLLTTYTKHYRLVLHSTPPNNHHFWYYAIQNTLSTLGEYICPQMSKVRKVTSQKKKIDFLAHTATWNSIGQLTRYTCTCIYTIYATGLYKDQLDYQIQTMKTLSCFKRWYANTPHPLMAAVWGPSTQPPSPPGPHHHPPTSLSRFYSYNTVFYSVIFLCTNSAFDQSANFMGVV